MNRRRFLLGLSCAASGAVTASPALTDGAILTLTRPDGSAVGLSLADLEALPQREIRTGTPWTEGVSVWTGPAFIDVLRAHGLDGETAVVATALNDYTVRIPVAEIAAHEPILATRADGAALSRRDKGPVFVMFAFDAMEQTTLKVLANFAVWQLTGLAPAR